MSLRDRGMRPLPRRSAGARAPWRLRRSRMRPRSCRSSRAIAEPATSRDLRASSGPMPRRSTSKPSGRSWRSAHGHRDADRTGASRRCELSSPWSARASGRSCCGACAASWRDRSTNARLVAVEDDRPEADASVPPSPAAPVGRRCRLVVTAVLAAGEAGRADRLEGARDVQPAVAVGRVHARRAEIVGAVVNRMSMICCADQVRESLRHAAPPRPMIIGAEKLVPDHRNWRAVLVERADVGSPAR